ncbi:uncharacterized protein LOC116337089 [Contarinia nasturtii]|uniref:uncharacterized protein LOC116337089 n=1 Tax=Contarinia nasturtii TaxID=265458 RepID=UPI0012D469B5|nr:uncharacterized protein LOC116337089 [Contarinia nasturtii]
MKPLYLVFFFVSIFGINFAFGKDSTMFQKRLVDELKREMKAIEDGIIKLDHIIQNAINENPGNTVLIDIQQDFNNHFHPVVGDLKGLYAKYLSCCLTFDQIYSTYLEKVNDPKHKSKSKTFQRIIKEWQNKVFANFMIKSYIKTIKKKLDQLSDEKNVLYSYLNEAIEYGTFEKNMQVWKATTYEADQLVMNMLVYVPHQDCSVIAGEFTNKLNTLGLF